MFVCNFISSTRNIIIGNDECVVVPNNYHKINCIPIISKKIIHRLYN